MNETVLLAKSLRQGKDPLTLRQHLEDVCRAAEIIFDDSERWGRNWCRFFRLTSAQAREKFLLNLKVAALLHDIGKANEEFSTALRNSQFKQTLRHEHLSALLLHMPELRLWLKHNPLLDVEIITAAVLSHHLKAAGKKDWGAPRTLRKSFKMLLQHSQVAAVLDEIKDIAQLPPVPTLDINTWSDKSRAWLDAKRDGCDTADRFRFVRDVERRALLLAVKAGLIVADAAASGLVREGHVIEDWIPSVARLAALSPDEVDEKIIAPRIDFLARKKPFVWQEFQTKSAELSDRALLIAPCGSGKTLAAWKWAAAQTGKRKVGKVIFLYPTRGTATEGFRDYVGWAPEADAKLVHGTSRYELDAMQGNPEHASDATRGKRYRREEDERLFSLALWSGRFFSATVDQFLGFMEHSYGALCLLPALADSVVIIDEVHSFDKAMFKSLEAFIQAFDVPVLCMTATLSPKRQEKLQAKGLELYPTKNDLENAPELESFKRDAERPRYLHTPLANKETAFTLAVKAYRNGERVLWVVNRVDECQTLAGDLCKELDIKVISYHSRYKLKDRQDKHKATIAAFQQLDEAAIAVTTQVCEMSLDIDADVLITEVAPVSSLVQRMGRANRHRAREKTNPDFLAQIFTYQPEKNLPYTPDEIKAANGFLIAIGTGKASQLQLAELLEDERFATFEPQSDGTNRFLDSGYFAAPGDFRDADEYTHPCVLNDEEELKAVKQCLDARQPIDSFIVNVPEKFAALERPSWLPKYLGVADACLYSSDYGFKTKE